MRLGTHVSGGVFGYTVAATLFQLPWTATGVVVAAGASALPDVDTLGSTVGRVFAPLARRIERRFGHRTLTHCYAAQLAVVLLASPLAWVGGGALAHLYAAVVVGYVSHPFLDTWTVQGVRVFYPWSDRRGVFPYYNRNETAYRTTTGSRVDAFFGVAFVVLTIPFGIVQHDGYQRFVRLLQADASAAVRDFLDWSAQGYLVEIEVEASDPQHLRRLEGRFEAVGTTGTGTLLVRDAGGRTFSLGPAYSANFQPDRAVAHRGERVTVSRRELRLDGRALADAGRLVPRDASGERVRHLIDGQLTLAEPAGITPDEHGFDTVTGSGTRIALQFATLGDLERLGLADALVESGAVTVRVYLRDGQAEGYRPDAVRAERLRRVAFAHKPGQTPTVLVRPGDRVAVGQTLAVRASAPEATARLDAQQARADLDALRAEPLPASYDPVALRSRLASARDAADRVAERHAQGYEPAAAVDAARQAVAAVQAELAHAQARAADWHRARAERAREAEARLARAQARQARAAREAAVPSTAAGVVRTVERRSPSPDRTEIHVVLADDSPAPSRVPLAEAPGEAAASSPATRDSAVPLTNPP